MYCVSMGQVVAGRGGLNDQEGGGCGGEEKEDEAYQQRWKKQTHRDSSNSLEIKVYCVARIVKKSRHSRIGQCFPSLSFL